MSAPIRVLTAVPICDGHDSAINTINLEFIRHGIEVVYLGFHRYVSDIVRAAIQEDVAAVGISSYNGGDRKSTRLNSSHRCISYAVFCLKKKKKKKTEIKLKIITNN